MIQDGAAIATACATHLRMPDLAGVGDEYDQHHFARMLGHLDDPGLPPSTFTDLSLAVLYAFAKGFAPDVLISIGAYRGVGARAMSVGRLAKLGTTKVQEILCDVDPTCGPQLHRHHANCLEVFQHKQKIKIAQHYTTVVTHAPSPGVIEDMPKAARYAALIDLDCPESGKAGYAVAARRFIETQEGSGLLIFHDVCVPRFANDIRALKQTLSDLSIPYLDLPIDDCGLGVAYAA